MNKIEEQFYIKLGKITHYQSSVEHHLSSWIIKLIDNDDLIGLIITSEMSYKNLINCLCSILLLKKEEGDKYIIENYQLIQELIKIINVNEQKRNTFAHSIYEFDDEKIIRKKYTAKTKGLKEQIEKVNIKDLDDLIDKQLDIISNITRTMYEKQIVLDK